MTLLLVLLPAEDGWLGWAQRYRRGEYDPLGPRRACRHPWHRPVKGAVVMVAAMLAAWTLAGMLVPSPKVALETSPASPIEVIGQQEEELVGATSRGLGMAVRVRNDYTYSRQLELYPWEHVTEPHRVTVMEVASPPDDALFGGEVDFRWEVDGVIVWTGASLETTFEEPGIVKCSVTAFRPRRYRAFDADGSNAIASGKPAAVTMASPTADIAVKHSFEVTVKYVRREIRSLTDRDRETFFNAVSVMQRVPSAVGRQIYGERYYSKDYFNRMHLYYGGQADCDHWHDGAGFVTSHIALSLMFEQALQAVNPSISLPYWDFTVEGTAYDWTNFRTSGVFSDDWFGEAAPRNAYRTPDRGRFAFVPAMADASDYSDLANAFGRLRSPWNSDPSPFLTRHDHIAGYMNNRKPAGCKQYRDAVLQQSWMALTHAMNAGAHGHIHELLGGTWSTIEWSDFAGKTEEIVFPFVHNIVPFMKYIWRSGYLSCPEYCHGGMLWDECQCTCPDPSQTTVSPAQVLEESGLLSPGVGAFFYDRNMTLIEKLGDEEGRALPAIPGYTEEYTRDIYAELLRVLCTPMRIGTHYEGTSTNDVTFWVLHPTFDRLWHLWRLQDDPNFDETWIGNHSCYGHNPTDVQPFHDLFGSRDADDDNVAEVTVAKEYHTNEQLYELLRPDGPAIPYVYDHFKWPHCDAIGIHMRG